jgi:hypothetical protein
VELLTQPRELGSDSKGNRSVHDWHCGCLLKDDADAFSGIGEDSGWTWSAGRSGSNWDHVIVLDPEHCTGWITKAEPRMHHVYLRKLSSSGGWDDLSFLNLRKLAARTMLDAVARHAIQASL